MLPIAASGKSREKSGRRSIVAEGLADMRIEIDVAGTEDEASAKLEGILAQPVLPVAGGPRSFPGPGVVAAEEMEQRRGSEVRGAIRLPPLVN